MLAIAELNVVPFPWERALPVSTELRVLARMPRAVVAEFPFYGERIAFPLHAQYMVFSTRTGCRSSTATATTSRQDFRDAASCSIRFRRPTRSRSLQKRRVRYVGIHWDMYRTARWRRSGRG